MRLLWLELKSIGKSFRFLAIIVIVLAFQVMLFSQFEGESTIASTSTIIRNNAYRAEMDGWKGFWQTRIDDPVKFSSFLPVIEYNFGWYEYEAGVAQSIYDSHIREDWPVYNRSMAERYMLEWKFHLLLQKRFDRHPSYDNLPEPEQYFGSKWDSVNTLIDNREWSMAPLFFNERVWQEPEEALIATVYHLYLLQEGLPPKGPYDTSPWGFTFNYLRRGLPNIIGVIVLLMTVNLLHRDKKSGSIKATLQLPKSRAYYLFRKVCLGSVASVVVVLIPKFLMFLFLGIKQGFSGFNFPVLIDNGLMKWSTLPDPVPYRLKDYSPTYNFGLSQFQLSVPNNYSALERLDVIPLWQFLVVAVIFVAVFIVFYAVIGVLISTLVKNELFAQVIAVGTVVMGAAFGNIFPQLKTTPWDIFSKINIVPLLEGNYYSTYLSSLVTICVAIVLLFTLSTFVFNKQDIFCDQ